MSSRKGFRPQPTAQSGSDANRLLKLFNAGEAAPLEVEARRFVKKFPNHVLGHKALSVSLTMQSRYAEALQVAKQAVAKFPLDSELHNNLAAALIRSKRHEEAIKSAQRAIDLNPKNGGAHTNMGLAYKHLGAWGPALNSYSRAIELDPGDFKSLNNAGVALIEMEKLEEAIICLKAALEIKPDYTEAIENLARANEDLKLYTNAGEEYSKLIAIDPKNIAARLRLVHILRTKCLFEEAAEQTEIALSLIRGSQPLGNLSPFSVLSLDGSTLEDQRIAGYAHVNAEKAEFLDYPPLSHRASGALSPERRPLRIGYLSADFYHHATVMLMIGALEAHDKNSVEIYIYSHGIDDGTELRRRAERACHVFRNIRPLSFLEAARLIADDDIDILVDLKGYTNGERLNICAQRPAPVIVSWLGYPGTLGHPRMADYLIGDPIVTPLEHQPHYSEILALMPHCYQPNDNRRMIAAKPERASLGLPEDGLVFCSFNQTYKVTGPVFEQWCRLLNSVPNSVLWLMVANEDIRNNLLNKAAQYGVDRSRFIFAAHVAIAQHLGRLQQADLALDTLPYGSHTTGSDALWAGVPLIAIKGNTFASRVSSSLLESIGLPELITESPLAACDLAIALAHDKHRLDDIKARLAAARTDCHLFNTLEFTRDLERLYHAIWERHQAGDKTPIVLKPQL